MKNKNKGYSRRDVLRLGAIGGATAGISALVGPAANAAQDLMLPAKKLLVVNLRGGVDMTNAIIPYIDGDYTSARTFPLTNKSIAVPIGASLNIDNGNNDCRLNPALSRLSTVIQNGHMVFLNRVGNTRRTGSHFEDMRALETGILECDLDNYPALTEEGWGTRLAAARFPIAFRGASVSNRMQQVFQTADPAKVMTHIRKILETSSTATTPGKKAYTLEDTTAWTGNISKLRGNTAPPSYGLRPQFSSGGPAGLVWDTFSRGVGTKMLDSEAQVSALKNKYRPLGGAQYPFGDPNDPIKYPTPGSVGLIQQAAGFAESARDAVWTLKSTSARIAGIELGGFDTHGAQGDHTSGAHFELMKVLGWVLDAIYRDTQGPDSTLRDSLTTLVVSEFGRTSAMNPTLGTDHGAGTCYWVMGSNVRRNPSSSYMGTQSLVYNCDPTTWASGTGTGANDGDLFSANATGRVLPTVGPSYICIQGLMASGVGTFIHPTHDFRAVFAEVFDKIFNASPHDIEAIIPGASTLPRLNYLT